MENTRRNKIVIVTISLIALIGLVTALLLSLRQPGGIAVQVNTVPKDAKILANGKRIRNGTVYLEPGNYSIEVSKKGFNTVNSTIAISVNRTYIQEALNPVSTETKAWAAKNNKLYLEFEGLAGRTAQKTGDDFYKRNTLAKLLPIDKLTFKIGYLENPDGSITLNIYSVDALSRAEAMQQILDWGYDLTDYKITFTGFFNPLEQP